MISVIMCLNRLDEYVDKSILSVLGQSFKKFELIIVANGGSSLDIKDVLTEKYSYDNRVRIFSTKIPQLSYALNFGVDQSCYDLIARMDADDICELDRLESQFDLLVSGDYDLVIGGASLINEKGDVIGCRIPPTSLRVKRMLPIKNHIVHPTVIMKKLLLINARGYNSGFNSEDYDLWLRLMKNNIKLGVISRPVIKYRIHSQASQRKLLGYAESSGHLFREFILSKNFIFLIGSLFQMTKGFIRGR